jgi:hypothetical protein
MVPQKCPCCDGYGARPRPPHLPGEGPFPCVSCGGKGLLWTALPTPLSPAAGCPFPLPLVPVPTVPDIFPPILPGPPWVVPWWGSTTSTSGAQ